MESVEGQVTDPRLSKVGKTSECVSSVSPTDATSTGLQLLLEDPLLLQDLVAEEKNRGLDDQIDLDAPLADHQPLRVVGWYRLRLSFALGEIHIRIKNSSEGTVVLVMKLDAFNLAQYTTDIRDVKNLEEIPSYASELLHGKEHTVDYSTGYILLVYNASHGWEMAGFLDPSAPSQSPIDVGGFVSSEESDKLLQTLTEPTPTAAAKSHSFPSIKVKEEPSDFEPALSENVLPSLLNDNDYCSSDDTIPLGSPKNTLYSCYPQIYDLEDFSNSPKSVQLFTTSGEADLSLPNMPLVSHIKKEKDASTSSNNLTTRFESQSLQEVDNNEPNDADYKPDPILMFLPEQLTSSPDYPVISIKEEEAVETTSVQKVFNSDLSAGIPLATQHPSQSIREPPSAILIKNEQPLMNEEQQFKQLRPTNTCSQLVQLRTYKKCPICLKDIFEPLYDLHLALHGPVQTALNATHYGVNKQKQKCPICLDEISVQLYDMHQALHRSQNLEKIQSHSTVRDDRLSAVPVLSNVVETASNQVPLLIPIQSQLQQPDPSIPSTESDAQNITDREAMKNKLIKQQLVLLLHASKCQKENGLNQECTIPPCRTMRNVLAHLPLCRDGDSCKISHCISSRAIILHWKNCKKLDCIICFSIKQADRKKSETNTNFSQFNHSALLSSFINTATSSQTSASKKTRTPSALVPLNLVQQHQVIDLTDDTPVLPSSCLTVEAQGNDFKAEPVQASKQWHLTVSSQLRDHLLLKLYKTVLPTIDTQLSPSLLDPRIQKLISYLRQIEKDFFIMADSRNNYYQMLAEKIFVIQEKLKEKRKQLATANADLMAHIVVNPVMVLKPWHWSVEPTLRRHLILKFVALVFKEANLSTSNIDHVKKIAAYAASIEVKVFQSTESQNDYNREITKEYSVALAKLKMRKQLRMQQDLATSLRTNTTVDVQIQSIAGDQASIPQSTGNACSASTSHSCVIPTQTFPTSNFNNVRNAHDYELKVVYETPHSQKKVYRNTPAPPPYPQAQQQQQQRSLEKSSNHRQQQPYREPQQLSQPPTSCSVLQTILERPTSDQNIVRIEPHNVQHMTKTVTPSNDPIFFLQQPILPDTHTTSNTHGGLDDSLSDRKSLSVEQQQLLGSCRAKQELETDFMQKCNICLKVFGKRKQYEQHMITHDPSQWKRCDRCNFTAPRSSYIRNHAAMAHGDQFVDPAKESETAQQMKRPRLSTDEL